MVIKKPPKGGVFSFVMLTSWVLALAPYKKQVAGQSLSQVSTATLHDLFNHKL